MADSDPRTAPRARARRQGAAIPEFASPSTLLALDWSTNGTYVNEVSVGRCELRPGDQVVLGGECLMLD